MGLNTSSDNIEFNLANELSAAGTGFSLDSYRNVNSVRIYLYSDNDQPTLIFRAFYKGNFGYQLALRSGDFGGDFREFMNNGLLGSVVSRSVLKSVSTSLGAQSLSGAFDVPVKPFIKGTDPLSFTLNCFLPLIEKGDGTDTFETSIQNKIDTLTGVVMPFRHGQAEKIKKSISDYVDRGIEWLFKGTDSVFWKAVQDVIVGLKEDFLGDVYVLSEPIQFDRGNKLVVRIGPWRIDGVFIEKVLVDYSPLIYTASGTSVYPAYANVTVECKTLKPATPECLGVAGNKDEFISKYLGNYKERK